MSTDLYGPKNVNNTEILNIEFDLYTSTLQL